MHGKHCLHAKASSHTSSLQTADPSQVHRLCDIAFTSSTLREILTAQYKISIKAQFPLVSTIQFCRCAVVAC